MDPFMKYRKAENRTAAWILVEVIMFLVICVAVASILMLAIN
jgi:hypothetical protein